MIHKQFQHDTIDGGTDVQFNLEYDGKNVSVSNIQLHSNFNSGLPHSAYLEYDHEFGDWKLCAYYNKEDINKNIINVREWIGSNLSKEIVKKILEIKENETPNFTK